LVWKTYQEALGKKVVIYASKSQDSTIDGSALIVIDTTVGGLSTWEIPRGPLMSEKWKAKSEKYDEEFLNVILAEAKKEKCIAVYISPPSLASTHFPLSTFNFQLSTRHIQPEATRVIDLKLTEEEILAGMHSKGRYNITLAKKHGVEVSEGSGSDIDAFYELLKNTGSRDGFKISQKSHYTRFLTDLQGSFLLLARHEHRPIAGLMGVMWPSTQEKNRGQDVGLAGPASGATPLREEWARGRDTVGGPSANCIYYYGASSYADRSLMAPYLLQWEAMRAAKARGCVRYDLLGISPDNAPRNDPWRGITDFKRKFGGAVVTYSPEQMLVLKPFLKAALEMKRRIAG